MRKRTHFDSYWGDGWPSLAWLGKYFLTPAGRRQFFAAGNDSWGISIEGVDGSGHLPPFKGRIDISLTILGHQDLGVLLFYDKSGGGGREAFYSKGDLSRLHEWVRTTHDDLMPMGLFIPFETAWTAVKEFIERDGALPTGIAWIASGDIPDGAFPPP